MTCVDERAQLATEPGGLVRSGVPGKMSFEVGRLTKPGQAGSTMYFETVIIFQDRFKMIKSAS